MIFVHSSVELYGADRMLLQVLDTRPEGIDCEVWLPDDVPVPGESILQELDARGIPWHIGRVPVVRRQYLSVRGMLRLIPRTFDFVRRLRRVHAAGVYLTTSATLLAAPLSRLAGVRSVVLHVQEIWSGGEANILAVLGRFVGHGIAISDSVAASVRGPLAQRITVVTNGVPDSPAPRSDPSEHEGPLRFVVASRWNAWKGHVTLLTAWDADTAPGLLSVLGGPPPIGESVDVPGMIARLKHPETVSIVGEQSSIGSLIDEADFMIVPSDQPEPFGLVAIEAFSRGRAVIASDGGGLAQIVADRETGRLFPLRDSASLRVILGEATRADAARWGAAARSDYEERYSARRFAERIAPVWLHYR